MEIAFSILLLVLLAASVWGGIVLAIKWTKPVVARVFLALVLVLVFAIASTVAVISGCSAVAPINFH